jgi:hypothetical protein
MRPYHYLLEHGNDEATELFKSLEPSYLHELGCKLTELESYNLPSSLVEFLQGETLHFDLGKNHDFLFIEFYALVDTVPMMVDGQRFLRISKRTGEYGHILILWNPKDECVSFYDYEHEELGNIAAFDDFINDLAEFMRRIIDGDFA